MSLRKKNTSPEARTRVVQRTTPSQGHGTVFSYHANRTVRNGGSSMRDIEEPKRQEDPRPKKLFRWLKRLPTIGAMAATLLVTFLFLQLSSSASIKVIGTDNQLFLRDRKIYEEAARKQFASFFNGNKLTINTEGISRNLQQQFPELKAVSVTLPVVGNRPTVYVQPAVPKIILVGNSGMYLLDSMGRAMITGNQVPDLDTLHIPVVNDRSGITIALSKIALPQDTVAFIAQVAAQMAAKEITVSSLELPAGSNELHMRMDGVGYYVKFNLHGDAREEVGSYLSTRDYLSNSHKVPSEYVDVRVENRAYYR